MEGKEKLIHYVWTIHEGMFGVSGATQYGGKRVSRGKFEEAWNEARKRGFKLHPDYWNPDGYPMGEPPDYPGKWEIVDGMGRVVALFWTRDKLGRVEWGP